jgi:hypothetical protein
MANSEKKISFNDNYKRDSSKRIQLTRPQEIEKHAKLAFSLILLGQYKYKTYLYEVLSESSRTVIAVTASVK